MCHINAEQKRRCNIKNGFDTLQSLLPGGGATGGSGNGSGTAASSHGKSSDVSKAAMLHRGAEFIRQLRQERQQQQEEMDQLKQNIETLNAAIRLIKTKIFSYSLLNELWFVFLVVVKRSYLQMVLPSPVSVITE